MTLSAVVTALFVLIVVGVCLWLVQTYIPMAPPIKAVINVVVVLALVAWLLSYFGLLTGVSLGGGHHGR